MRPDLQAKMEKETASDKPQRCYILDLPSELILKIISLLSTEAVRTLMMANRFLRPTCEESLYKRIFLATRTRRTLSLFKTFLLRPDLAALVQHLEIRASYCNSGSPYQADIPAGLDHDGANALALATNVRSLAIAGCRDWIHRPERTHIRETVSKMKLTHLKIHHIYDDSIPKGCSRYTFKTWDGDFAPELRSVLQAQPLLESLSLVDCALSWESRTNLLATLVHSDLPKLTHVAAIPDIACAFLDRLPGIERIGFTRSHWYEWMFDCLSACPLEHRASVREVTIRMPELAEQIKTELQRILPHLPSTGLLKIYLTSWLSGDERDSLQVANCYNAISKSIKLLPFLRTLEVAYEKQQDAYDEKEYAGYEGSLTPFYPDSDNWNETAENFVADCKLACSLLERIVDHEGRIWMFGSDSGTGGRRGPEFAASAIGSSGDGEQRL